MSLGRKALNRLVVSASDYSREAGVTAMRRLAASPDLDAVFVASDLLASGGARGAASIRKARAGRRGCGWLRRLPHRSGVRPPSDDDPAAA
jgi:hypothetical protein